MIESLKLGTVTCDFVSREDFSALCASWLASENFHHVVTLNPEMVMLAEHDESFRKAVRAAHIRVPDGAGLIWAHWYIRSQFWSLVSSLLAFSFRAAERVTGVDTVMNLARLSQEQGRGVYLLGGTASQVEKTAQRLSRQFPTLRVAASPEHSFDMSGPRQIIEDIQKHEPAVLLVAYGAPKQSVWIEQHKHSLPSIRIAVGVGGAFAILSEERPRAPHIFQQLNLEWLWRLILEPSRAPRIWRAVVQFPRLISHQKHTAKT